MFFMLIDTPSARRETRQWAAGVHFGADEALAIVRLADLYLGLTHFVLFFVSDWAAKVGDTKVRNLYLSVTRHK